MDTIAGHLYDFPKYYDLAFGSDWKAEYRFLRECCEANLDHAGLDVEPARENST